MTRLGPALSLLAAAAMVASSGCTEPECPHDDSFLVNENGSCSPAPLQFYLATTSCRVTVQDASGMSGLPSIGAMGQFPVPLREGGFILYGDEPSFRLCHARRVDYWLELSCVDGNDDAVCQAILTEPAR